jgi:DMSO/TMAO reductase YedYZ heme-binding membrane subunit
MTSENGETVRAMFLAMDVASWAVLVPLAVASLVTGMTQSLGTRWGLLRHYWVVVKLWITVIATIVLLLYTATLEHLARVAERDASAAELDSPTVVVHAALALTLLLGATILAVFKPAGLTRRGRRRASSAP